MEASQSTPTVPTMQVATGAQTAIDLTTAIEAEGLPTDFEGRLSLYARLELVRRNLEWALERTKKRVAAMAEPLLEEMVENGISNAKVHGLSVHIAKKLSVRKLSESGDGVTTDMICDALTSLGRDDMVADTYSASSLKSWVKEMLDEGRDVPEKLEKLLWIDQRSELRTRQG